MIVCVLKINPKCLVSFRRVFAAKKDTHDEPTIAMTSNGSNTTPQTAGGPPGLLSCAVIDDSIGAFPFIWCIAAAVSFVFGTWFIVWGPRAMSVTTVLTSWIASFMLFAPCTMILFGADNVQLWAPVTCGIAFAFATCARFYLDTAVFAIGALGGAFIALKFWSVVAMPYTVGAAVLISMMCVFGTVVRSKLVVPMVIGCVSIYGTFLFLASLQILLFVTDVTRSFCAYNKELFVPIGIVFSIAVAVHQYKARADEYVRGLRRGDYAATDNDSDDDGEFLIRS